MTKAVKSILLFLVLAAWGGAAVAQVTELDKLNRRYGAVGSYRALVVGIDVYSDAGIQSSGAAVAGARDVASALAAKAGCEVRTLFGAAATKEAILRELRVLSRAMGVGDNVVLFFSGTSKRGDTRNEGWWLPSDAALGDPETWISSELLCETINTMKVKDVLVFSDAYLADGVFGASHRLPAQRDDSYYLTLFNKRSRWGVTSGNLMPKPYKGGGSLFARTVAKGLGEASSCLTTMEMMGPHVKALRSEADLAPRCRSLRNTGDQGGEFVFLLENEVKKAKVAAAPKKVVPKPAPKPAPAPVPKVTLEAPKPKPIPKKGTLHVAANVRGARVLVDGRLVGETPVKGITLGVGKHKVRIRKDGYLAWAENVTISGGKKRRITASLKKEPPKTGKVFLTLKPAKAKVLLDGKPFKSGSTVKVGSHTLKVSSTLYASKTLPVEVSSGGEARVEVYLQPVKVYKGDWGRYVYVAPGDYRMGSPSSEPRRKADEEPHPVSLKRGFYIQDREVTVSQWQRFVASTGYKTEAESKGGAYALEDFLWNKSGEYTWKNPGFTQGGDHPVTCITYADALAFIDWLNGLGSFRYRLPTEAEWEFAARAGSGDAFSTGSCISSEHANINGNVSWGGCPPSSAPEGTVPVGRFAPNPWGLYDMHGNVAEWCRDWYAPYPTGSTADPLGPSSGNLRVVRGGGWATYAYNARSAHRGGKAPDAAYSEVGMRLVMELPQ